MNVLDVTVPAGDYQLVVHNLNSEEYECGLFSLKGLLNQQSAMIQATSVDAQGFMQSTMQCEVRGDYLPSVIYSSKENVMGGNEEFVNDSGAYFKRFENVLVEKNFKDVIEPWSTETEITTSSQSILKIVLWADFADMMAVRLVNRVSS